MNVHACGMRDPSAMRRARQGTLGIMPDAPSHPSDPPQSRAIRPSADIGDERDLLALAGRLVRRHAIELTPAESELVSRVSTVAVRASTLEWAQDSILAGLDPLGTAFGHVRSAAARRVRGATFTPEAVIASMLDQCEELRRPDVVVDPGAGTGRFARQAARRFPAADIVAVEADPSVAVLLRATLAAEGLTDRVRVRVEDYRAMASLPPARNRLFIGNPPYVRHHQMSEEWKAWYRDVAAGLGIRASRLAGLHLHFFFKTAELAGRSDFGSFITSSEWLDVNYGAALRRLLVEHLGLTSINAFEPTAPVFADAMTTSVVTTFDLSSTRRRAKFRVIGRPESLARAESGIDRGYEELADAERWTPKLRAESVDRSDHVPLGEIFRVHRGQVTGANRIWIARSALHRDLPPSVLFASVTRAREVIESRGSLDSPDGLDCVVDIPVDLGVLTVDEREAVERFLRWAEQQGARDSYIARHRRAWWSVGLKKPAPILCTYMGRRPPAFTVNKVRARHINVAHGLYPRESMPDGALRAYVYWLNANVARSAGRTYSGGLTKFEPRELERLLVPSLDTMRTWNHRGAGPKPNSNGTRR